MYVVAIAQAFKETLSVAAVAQAIEQGVRAAGARGAVLSASDGGDGLLDALGPRLLRRTLHRVTGPLGAPRDVPVGWLDARTAVVESSRVCGLALLPPAARDPERATTRGVGELILAAAVAGAKQVFVGLGGSATMDGGVGMASAWEIPPAVTLVGLCDVAVPLAGAERFAAQKGASPAMQARLVTRLDQLGRAHPVAARCAGAGAAGGLGFGLVAFGGGTLVPGAPWVLDRIGFAQALDGAEFVLVAEGAFDGTSGEGKLTGHVLARVAGHCPAGILAPTVTDAPPGVLVESGGGTWGASDVAHHAEVLVRRASAA